MNSPKFATALGLMEYLLNADKIVGGSDVASVHKGRFIDRLKLWFEEMF